MNRVDHPEAWDVTIAGVTWSGAAEIAGLKYSMGWDIQEADGKNGASLARKGRKLSQFTIRFGMVVDPTQDIDQFTEWYETWLPLLKSCFVGTDPVGLVIENAEAQALEVDSIVVADIGQVQRVGEDDGEGFVDVSVIQYAPAKTVGTGGPSGSKGGGASGKGSSGAGAGATDPNDPIQNRTDKLNELLEGP
jgi:hypothetical protein